MALVDIVIIGIFLVGIFWVGTLFTRWIKTPDDFYVAGREMTPFILAATLTATNVNLYSFVAQAGSAYGHGLSIIWHTWTGNMALVFSGLFVLPILRRLRIRTIPEFLELRYNVGARSLISILWIFRLSFWLGIGLYLSAIAAEAITGINNYTLWIMVFSVIAIIYTILGGMWAVAITDVLQFLLMLAGGLIVLPLVMKSIGWWPGMVAKLPADYLNTVVSTGPFNWKFILAIWILGIEWACVDQGMMQRVFSAKNATSAAKGLVIAGIVTTPFALLWCLPGVAARVSSIIPNNLTNPDMAIPLLLVGLLPPVALGLMVCGLIAAQMSTIDSNLSAVATLYTHDIYNNLLRKKASTKDVLKVARNMTFLVGIFMIGFSYLVPKLGGAVNAYLTIVGIMDMPLFIIAIVYGLCWKRTSAVGAIIGYLCGALAGVIARFGISFGLPWQCDFAGSAFISAISTLIICPLVSWLTKPVNKEKIKLIWQAHSNSVEEEKQGDIYNIIPTSKSGKIGLFIFCLGLIIWLIGVLLGSIAFKSASLIAIIGMIVYFAGGLIRVFNK